MVGEVDADTKGLYRAGGISAIVLGMSYIVITALYVFGGAPPGEAEAWLKHLSERPTAWWAILGLSVLTDFLFVPVALAVYVALREINRNAMLAGTGLVVSFAVLDLAVTWPNYSSLITLSGRCPADERSSAGGHRRDCGLPDCGADIDLVRCVRDPRPVGGHSHRWPGHA